MFNKIIRYITVVSLEKNGSRYANVLILHLLIRIQMKQRAESALQV